MPMEGKRWRALREGRVRHRNPDKMAISTLPASAADTTLVSHLQCLLLPVQSSKGGQRAVTT
jgi:hypothetical protein